MPVYDFKCETCGNTRTDTISIHVQEYHAICHCGTRMSRVYVAPNVKFNGTEFYSTDKNKK